MRLVALAALVLAAPTAGSAQGGGWLGFSVDSGPPVRVREVAPGSPAEDAGLLRGDTLLRIGGRPATLGALSRAVRQAAPGQTVAVEVRRRGVRTLRLVVGRRFGTPPAAARAPSLESRAAPVRTAAATYLQRAVELVSVDCPGATQQRLDPATNGGRRLRITLPVKCLDAADSAGAERIRGPGGAVYIPVQHASVLAEGLLSGVELIPLAPPLDGYFPGARGGLLVLRVTRGLPAAEAGLQPGDVITEVEGRAVRDGRELAATAGARRLRVTAVRHGRRVPLTLAYRAGP
ncbi:MAG TPA: PDZ domain-containing protein [Longimicrobium sp.]|jgi:S1-C subfamily serine protease